VELYEAEKEIPHRDNPSEIGMGLGTDDGLRDQSEAERNILQGLSGDLCLTNEELLIEFVSSSGIRKI